MQGYGPSFARVYNMRWGFFARSVGPRLLDYYEAAPFGAENKTLLDLCCGTGQLARLALERGYQVIGIDLSEAMLKYARENNLDYVVSGQARFELGDASNFTIENPVGLAISTFDALNHLESLQALQNCFRCVYASVVPGGTFIFDLNTRLGLNRWNSVSVEDTDEIMLVNRGIFVEENNRGYTHISGFLRREDGLYERFEETAYNNLFDLQAVRQLLLEAGWKDVTLAQVQDLNKALEDPEKEGRVFFIARK